MIDSEEMLFHLREIEKKTAEYQKDFSFDRYKTVRKELFAHLRDPAITIRNDSVTFNTACINAFENVLYIKIHLNDELKRIVITPSQRDARNSLRWCTEKADKRMSRRIVGKHFSEMVYQLMGWEENRRYKSMGFKIKVNKEGEVGFLFDLLLTESFEYCKRPRKKKNSEKDAESNDNYEVMKTTARQEPLFSDALLSSFGDPAAEDADTSEFFDMEGYTTISSPENN